MIKILVLCIYLLTLSSGGNARRHSTTTTAFPIVDPSNPYDLTNALQQTIAQILDDYRSTYQEWKNNNALTEAIRQDVLTTYSQQSQIENLSLEYGSISITRADKTNDYDMRDREISCLFGNNIKFQMPIPGFKLRGTFNITSNKLSTPANYEYEITLKSSYFSFTAFSNFNESQDLPNNQSKIDISFKRINLDWGVSDNDEELVVTQINELLKTIKSSMRTSVYKKLASMLQQKTTYSTVFAHCMQPKKSIERYSPNFATTEYQYYYLITDQSGSVDSWDNINLKCTPIKIRGLWNFDSLSLKGVDYTDVTFVMKFDNLEGEVNCSYSVSGENSTKPYEIKFKIDAMAISGNLERTGGSVKSMSVDLEPSLEDAEGLGQIKKIVKATLKTSLINKYQSL